MPQSQGGQGLFLSRWTAKKTRYQRDAEEDAWTDTASSYRPSTGIFGTALTPCDADVAGRPENETAEGMRRGNGEDPGRGVGSEPSRRGRVRFNVREASGILVDMAGLSADSLVWSRAPVTTLGGGSPGRAGHFPTVIGSRRLSPALNAGVFEAATVMLSPVARLRPCRAERARVENVQNPTMATVSSLASASPIIENAVETMVSAVILETPARAATWAQSSDLFMRRSPQGCVRKRHRCGPLSQGDASWRGTQIRPEAVLGWCI